jgi:8-oxo-dGTP pyrophosphatase MutT (NUDIX family)
MAGAGPRALAIGGDCNLSRGEFKEEIRSILSTRRRTIADNPRLKCAAVLIPLACKEREWHVVVTQRTETVEHHKGQISFPGGACEAWDADLQATALRETQEEIGVPPDAVEVLGALDDFSTITHFAVTPFVGIIPHPFDYRPSDDEVQAIIEVPLSFLLDPSHLRIEQREHEGQILDVLFWDFGPYTIWGATARVLKNFLDLIH